MLIICVHVNIAHDVNDAVKNRMPLVKLCSSKISETTTKLRTSFVTTKPSKKGKLCESTFLANCYS